MTKVTHQNSYSFVASKLDLCMNTIIWVPNHDSVIYFFQFGFCHIGMCISLIGIN